MPYYKSFSLYQFNHLITNSLMLSKGENDKANATNNALIEMYLNANESKLTSYEEFNMMIESIRSKLNSSCGLNVKSRACSVNGSDVDSEIVRGEYSHLWC